MSYNSQETEEEQPQMEVTEADAEPEAEQEEADQMRDTDEGSVVEAIQQKPPGWEMWSKAQHTKWKKKRSKESRRN